MAAAPGALRPGPGVPVAGTLRGAALRVCPDHAGRHLGVAAGLRGPVPRVVARGARDSVLASHRARAAPGSGHRRPDAVRVPGSHEHRAAVVPAARATPVLQQRGVRPDDGGDVLSPIPKRPRRRTDAVQLRPPYARGHDLTVLLV